MADVEGNPGGGGGEPVPSAPHLAPAGSVAGGRYRLLAPHGGRAGLRYWQARDQRLGREVALVFVDPTVSASASTPDSPRTDTGAGGSTPAKADRVLDETLALSKLWVPGVAAVLDVVRGKVGGIIVAEWTPGRSFAAAHRDARGTAATSADAETLRPLADAASRTHARRLVLGLSSPDQLRVTDSGETVLAFPAVSPTDSREQDVRALGAILYATLTGTWPWELPTGAADLAVTDDRLPEASRTADGTPVDPQTDGAPIGLATLAMRTLDGSSVSSASTVLSLVDDAGRTAGDPDPDGDGTGYAVDAYRSPAGSSDSGEGAANWDPEADGEAGSSAESRSREQHRWMIMAGAGAVGVVLVVVLLIAFMGGFGTRDSEPLSDKLDAMQRSQTSSREAEESRSEEATATSGARDAGAQGRALTVAQGTTWQPATSAGNAENAAMAMNAVDGNPSTVWQTDTYEQQFGASAFKAGLGLMLTLDTPATLSELHLTTPDRTMAFEVRTSTTATPTALADTELVGKGTATGGEATVDIPKAEAGAPTQYVLVWITELDGSQGTGFQSHIGEIEITGTPGGE